MLVGSWRTTKGSCCCCCRARNRIQHQQWQIKTLTNGVCTVMFGVGRQCKELGDYTAQPGHCEAAPSSRGSGDRVTAVPWCLGRAEDVRGLSRDAVAVPGSLEGLKAS